MRESLVLVLFFASFFGPLALEHWMHRRRAGRLARFAFVDVGVRRLACVSERFDSSRETYRGGEVRHAPLLLPKGEWALRGPNEGTIDVWVAPGRTHAVARVDIPWKPRGTFWGPRPTHAIATLRIEPAQGDEGWTLRAKALPQALLIAIGPVLFMSAVAARAHPLASVFILLVGALFTVFAQVLWWLFYAGVVRHATEQALDVVGRSVEAEAGVGTHTRP